MIKNYSFRMFISSTFKDFADERTALTENIFPLLLKYCREHNSDFQVIDMRWGISREYNLENAVLPICLEEIKKCKTYGTYPNFLIMLGDRYGWCPLPCEIDASELELILKKATKTEKNSILEWYKKDENACPAVYCLKKRNGIYKDENVWSQKESKLHEVLLALASESNLNEDCLQKYYTSATEQEIICGLFNDLSAREHVVVLLKQNTDKESNDFEVKRARLLKEKVCSYVPKENIIDINSSENYQEQVYKILLKEIVNKLNLYENVDKYVIEEYLQAEFVSEHQKCYCMREAEEARLRLFLNQEDFRVKCVCGMSGTGKTSILTNIVAQSKASWIYVFSGATSRSRNILDIIDYFFENIKKQGIRISNFEKKYDTAIWQFESMLKTLPENREWKFMIDGVDNIHDIGFLSQSFLTLNIPKHVKVVVSFVEPNVFVGERKKIINPIYQVGALEGHQSWKILKKRLDSVSRTLTEEQKKFIVRKLYEVPLPLYVDLVFSIVSKWKSWEEPTDKVIKNGYIETINALLDEFISEERIGRYFLKHSLGYFSNVKYGLKENEILELLSCDEKVMNEMKKFSQWKFDEKKGIPYI